MPIYSQEDYTTFGWKASNNKEPTEKDFMINGKYCQSGLAYPVNDYTAKCTSFKEMKFAGKVIEEPFACNATNQNFTCQLFFNIEDEDKGYTEKEKRSYVTNQCKCALDGKNTTGYCSNVMGTLKYQRAVKAFQNVMKKSNCHTMDRNNLYAQRDKCGIGTGNEEWRFAVD